MWWLMHRLQRSVAYSAIWNDACGMPQRRHSLRDLRLRIRHLESLSACVEVLRLIAANMRAEGTDDLCRSIVQLWALEPPSESELCRLSTLQQRCTGVGGEEDFAVTTLWLCACQYIMETERRRRMPRCQSATALRCSATLPLAARSASF